MIEISLCLVVALFISMLLTPVLVRRAAGLRLMDVADARKSHSGAIPRVGGIAIALGTLLPILFWLHAARDLYGYLAGAVIIVIFGIWDDRANLGYKPKLLGQFLAAIAVVASGIEIQHLPFAGLDPLSLWIGVPLTVVFLVGVTNAFNLLDGLDGLAGGCAILSIGATALLAFLTGANEAVLIVAAGIVGAVLGFLRHNTHPATVFMGDAGSQFLGFSIGTLVIMLMELPTNAMSPAVPLLLLGLPVLDTTMVILLRLRAGKSPFSPDRNHIHHRLLSLGLRHNEAVAIMYVVQAIMVFSAPVLRFQSDSLVVAWYLALCTFCIVAFALVRRLGWQFHRAPGNALEAAAPQGARRVSAWPQIRARLVELWLPLTVQGLVAAYLIASAISAGRPSADIGITALVLTGMMVVALAFSRRSWAIVLVRGGAYVAALLVTYMTVVVDPNGWFSGQWVNAGVIALAAAVGLTIYLQKRGVFEVTTLDLLIALVAVVVLTAPMDLALRTTMSELVLRVFVVFYAIELLLVGDLLRARLLAGTTLISLAIVAVSSVLS